MRLRSQSPRSRHSRPRHAFVSELHGTADQRKALVAAQTARRIGAPLQQVFVMNADGSNPTQVTRDGGFAPTWSPDGRQLAFVGVTDWRADDSIQEWSSKRDIFVIDTDGRNLRNITKQAGSDNYPTWSPDGRSIAFAAHREGHAWAEIYVINVDGSDQRRLTFNTPGTFEECCDDSFPRWSPDGRWISFVSKRDGNSELYKMHPDGTEQTRLTKNSGFDAYASWSPTGQFLAFTHRSERTGFGSLFIMRADGTDMRGRRRRTVGQLASVEVTIWHIRSVLEAALENGHAARINQLRKSSRTPSQALPQTQHPHNSLIESSLRLPRQFESQTVQRSAAIVVQLVLLRSRRFPRSVKHSRSVMRTAHAWRRAGKLYRPSLETRPLAHTSATPNTPSASV